MYPLILPEKLAEFYQTIISIANDLKEQILAVSLNDMFYLLLIVIAGPILLYLFGRFLIFFANHMIGVAKHLLYIAIVIFLIILLVIAFKIIIDPNRHCFHPIELQFTNCTEQP